MAGRGHLSRIDQLPEEAAEDVSWAVEQLAARKLTQEEIRLEFNRRLDAKGIEPISVGAFHRKSVKLADAQRRIAEQRAMFEGIAPQFTPENIEKHNIILGAYIQTLIGELLSENTARTPKAAMELASAHSKVVAAMKISTDRKAALEAELAAKTRAAVEAVGKERGFSAETVAAINAKILGV